MENNMLKSKIENSKPGILTYGFTPPKLNNTEEKIIEITNKKIERIKTIDVDGLVIYDLQDEKDRISEERPFPFLPTVDPAVYSNDYMNEIDLPKIIYRAVGKYLHGEMAAWLNSTLNKDCMTVFVGAPSKKQQGNLSINEAYNLRKRINPELLLGGVTIPERHLTKKDEHLRLIDKTQKGCSFFISQAVYNVEASKNLLSDYYYYCGEQEFDMVPIIFTFTPCGSLKTLEFMKWLGINIPSWFENELKYSVDILDKSLKLSINTFEELVDFACEKSIPVGCNVESVSIRKDEIDASIDLVRDIKKIFTKKGI